VLGLWSQQSEGTKFGLAMMNELKNCGFEDTLMVAIDRLKGLPEAISTVYLQAKVQTYIIHLMYNWLLFRNWKEQQNNPKRL
jgi:transposase-like protein